MDLVWSDPITEDNVDAMTGKYSIISKHCYTSNLLGCM
jgi:hypothetical protein